MLVVGELRGGMRGGGGLVPTGQSLIDPCLGSGGGGHFYDTLNELMFLATLQSNHIKCSLCLCTSCAIVSSGAGEGCMKLIELVQQKTDRQRSGAHGFLQVTVENLVCQGNGLRRPTGTPRTAKLYQPTELPNNLFPCHAIYPVWQTTSKAQTTVNPRSAFVNPRSVCLSIQEVCLSTLRACLSTLGLECLSTLSVTVLWLHCVFL